MAKALNCSVSPKAALGEQRGGIHYFSSIVNIFILSFLAEILHVVDCFEFFHGNSY